MGTRAGLDVLDVPVLGIEILYAGPAARALVAVVTERSPALTQEKFWSHNVSCLDLDCSSIRFSKTNAYCQVMGEIWP